TSVLVNGEEAIEYVTDGVLQLEIVEATTIEATFTHDPLTVTVSHNGFGTTTPAAGEYEVEYGSLLEITFTPDADCTLTSVLVNGEEAIEYVTDGVLQLEIVEATTIEATFTHDPLTVTVSHNGFGTTTPAAGEYEVEYGTPMAITFTPNDGCSLTSVLVNGVESLSDLVDGVLNLDVVEDVEVVAVFARDSHQVVVTHGGNGATDPAAGTHTVAHGDEFALRLIPDAEYMVQSVMVNGVEMVANVTDGVLTLNIVEDTTIDVVFTKIPKTGAIALTSFALMMMLGGAAVVIFRKD
ncbi:MAG: LPXTG cell wall anchor domain-containing protein, partial [Clostridia bacterium]|nr:LPXTG cell wall anchor domain-containing protein [Clostridia bacterium]